MEKSEAAPISAEEAEQYDRQIRLWGVEAQKKLRSSAVLVVGLTGLTAELIKNIVLAGIKSLTLIDHRHGDEDTIQTVPGATFLLLPAQRNKDTPISQTAQPRIQLLNPNVKVMVDCEDVEKKPDEYFTSFNVICASCTSTNTMIRLNDLCRRHGIKFYCGDVWGYYGYYFVDLNFHSYVVEEERSKSASIDIEDSNRKKGKLTSQDKEKVIITKEMKFCPLQDTLQVQWDGLTPRQLRRTPPTYFICRTLQKFRDRHGRPPYPASRQKDVEQLKLLLEEVIKELSVPQQLVNDEFTKFCFSELSPVCAIVGGIFAQEVIKAISGKGEPFSNHFLYNGQSGNNIVEMIAKST